jgi:hydroxymethylglutaryl-CoA synthase
MDLLRRLASMEVMLCQDFVDALALQEKNHNTASYTPEGSMDNVWPGTYYLESIDSKYRRKYVKVPMA